MQVKEKTAPGLALLLAATLLLGLAIQVALAWREDTAALRRGSELLLRAGTELRGEAQRRLDRIRDYERWLADSAERLSRHLDEKRDAGEDLPRELLILVNPWNSVPEDYTPQLDRIECQWQGGYQMDQRCARQLDRMIEDCRAAGNAPYICSAYRTHWDQVGLFENKLLRVLYEDGVEPDEAEKVAARSVAYPGTSEHELGLAVDIIDENYPKLDRGQEETGTQKWLMENCWRYGFILRYPNGTTEITGIIYEPWHYRYVGPFAREISLRGITLEQYLLLLKEKNIESLRTVGA